METHTKTKTSVLTSPGQRIAAARIAIKVDGKPMSQGILAKRIGVSRALVSQYESGEVNVRNAKSVILDKLCKELRKNREYILQGKEGAVADMTDEAEELAHAWDEMPDGEWKERVYYFITTFKLLAEISHGEQKLSKGKRKKRD